MNYSDLFDLDPENPLKLIRDKTASLPEDSKIENSRLVSLYLNMPTILSEKIAEIKKETPNSLTIDETNLLIKLGFEGIKYAVGKNG